MPCRGCISGAQDLPDTVAPEEDEAKKRSPKSVPIKIPLIAPFISRLTEEAVQQESHRH